jgi:hypothetical protein
MNDKTVHEDLISITITKWEGNNWFGEIKAVTDLDSNKSSFPVIKSVETNSKNQKEASE